MFRFMALIMMNLGLKLQDYCVPPGWRALPRPAKQHICHDRREPAGQTPTHVMSIPSLWCWITRERMKTENSSHLQIRQDERKRNIQFSDLHTESLDDCWTFKDKIIIKRLKGHSVFIKMKSVPHMTGITCPLYGWLCEILYYIELFSQMRSDDSDANN